MPYYKGVYYADGASSMSVSDISAAEGSSINDVISSIRYGGMAILVANAEERDTIFPSPSDGNVVWREDIGAEQRYITGLGWVASADGFMPIPVQSAVPAGTNSTLKIDPIGGLTFTACTSVTINNIFTKEFDNYKVIINVDSNSAADTFSIRYTTNGVPNASANYVRAGIAATGATPVTFFNNSAANNFLIGDTGGRNFTAEVDFMRPAYGYYPLAISSVCSNNNSTGQTVGKLACQFNSASTSFDGIYIYSSTSGTSAATGNVKIYGYN